jgi:copper homeostasis protein
MNKFQFEVCANSVESCLAAQKGGANRVELCAGIPEGGTTPSYGEISVAREVLDATRLHVIIRPRGGDFLYSPIEVKAMLKDIEMAKQLKADGVVFGCLTAEGEIDLTIMQELMKAAQGLSVTFHRAFDVCRDPKKALEQIIALGCNRILTSGQQPTAESGIPLLKELQEQAAGRIILLAGCGVNEKNIHRIASETGIREFHFSARENIKSGMNYKNESVSMGGTVHIDEYERNVTTARRVMDKLQIRNDRDINTCDNSRSNHSGNISAQSIAQNK